MSDNHFPNDPAGAFYALHFPEFSSTWAGANPYGDGFCLGSETGQIVLVNTGLQRLSEFLQASPSGEAVNNAAYSQKWLAVTTRKDINFIGPLLSKAQGINLVTFCGGGRDVAVAPVSGHFVIPLGPDGIMFVQPGIGEKDPVTISKSENSQLNFSRVLALQGERGNDVIVCAGRRGGLGYSNYREGIRGHALHTVTFNGLDFVDVCSVATPDKPLAVVAAAKDGGLVFFDDILTDKAPKTLKYKGVSGTVYRVLAAQGNIYLLTSKGLFGLFGLATTFLRGARASHVSTDILKLPVKASDANIVGDRWLLAVGADEILRFDTEKIPKAPENGAVAKKDDEGEQPQEIQTQPRWEESGFEQKSEYMAAV
jgi:hypothetical protein